MQEAKWTMQRKNVAGLARATVGIVLFVLLIGLWACLWVPPLAF
jgi:hypothetical protein